MAQDEFVDLIHELRVTDLDTQPFIDNKDEFIEIASLDGDAVSKRYRLIGMGVKECGLTETKATFFADQTLQRPKRANMIELIQGQKM